VKKMTKAEMEAIRKEQEDIPALLVSLMDREPSDREVQKLIARHHALIEKFYHVISRGIGLSCSVPMPPPAWILLL